MNKKIRFGIIGTGAIAGMHAEAIRAIVDAELTAVYDVVEARSQAFSERFGVKAYSALDDFLQDKDIDAVCITTPTGLHAEVAIPVARSGKHVICEKPLDVNVSRADAIIEACRTNGVMLVSIFQSRYASCFQAVKQACENGRFGKVVMADAQLKWFRSQEYYDSAGWRGTWEMDGGGALMNQGIHTADLLIYLNGEPAEVFAYGATLTHFGIEVEDNLCAAIRFRNGALGVIQASTSCAPGFPRRLEISGSRGSVLIEGDRIAHWVFADETPEDAVIRDRFGAGEGIHGGVNDPLAFSSEGHRRQLTDVVDALLHRRVPLVPGAEGRKALQLVCGIYESMRTGQAVKF